MGEQHGQILHRQVATLNDVRGFAVSALEN
jgi:hypothetical protein